MCVSKQMYLDMVVAFACLAVSHCFGRSEAVNKGSAHTQCQQRERIVQRGGREPNVGAMGAGMAQIQLQALGGGGGGVQPHRPACGGIKAYLGKSTDLAPG